VSTDAASLAAALTAGVPLAAGFDRRALTAIGPRKWFKVDEEGEASIVEARGAPDRAAGLVCSETGGWQGR